MAGEFHIRGGFGHNVHILPDIYKALTGFDSPEDEILISPSTTDYTTMCFAHEDKITVWLGRKQIGEEERPNQDVWVISHVVANSEEDLDEFVELLEDLERERAEQIIESWKIAGWPTDYLETLSDRHIMVVDSLTDFWAGKHSLEHVQLDEAFEGGGGLVAATVHVRGTTKLPDSECKEYIAERIGPYEFTSLEAARIAWVMWIGVHHDPGATECMVAGLEAMGYIRRLPDWTGWEQGTHPFSFLDRSDQVED